MFAFNSTVMKACGHIDVTLAVQLCSLAVPVLNDSGTYKTTLVSSWPILTSIATEQVNALFLPMNNKRAKLDIAQEREKTPSKSGGELMITCESIEDDTTPKQKIDQFLHHMTNLGLLPDAIHVYTRIIYTGLIKGSISLASPSRKSTSASLAEKEKIIKGWSALRRVLHQHAYKSLGVEPPADHPDFIDEQSTAESEIVGASACRNFDEAQSFAFFSEPPTKTVIAEMLSLVQQNKPEEHVSTHLAACRSVNTVMMKVMQKVNAPASAEVAELSEHSVAQLVVMHAVEEVAQTIPKDLLLF